MPELPEVQTVVNHLSQNLLNKKIIDFKILYNKVIYNGSQVDVKKITTNRLIKEIQRVGKYIVIVLNKNYIVFHLRMTGRLYYSDSLPLNGKYLRCYFILENNSYLLFEDIRKFGGFYLYKNLKKINSKIALDPLQIKFTIKYFKTILSNRKKQIKSFLLDQSLISGLGNIYIDEILWKSKIHPYRLSNSLQKHEIINLYKNIKQILIKSIEFHGTTIINFTFDNMKTGNYKKYLQVYGRKDKLCFECKNTIKTIRASGRTTHICSKCQR